MKLRCRYYFAVKLKSGETLILPDLTLLPKRITSKDIAEVSHEEGYLLRHKGKWVGFNTKEETKDYIIQNRKHV